MTTKMTDYVTLNNGVKMPWLGFGVFRVEDGEQVIRSVHYALEAGYRSIDTAWIYGNETGVGTAVEASGIARTELFITTKLWNAHQGYDRTLEAFETSMNNLGLDYLDLYLIHWPGKDKFIDTWKAMERLYREGHIRAIGVSNFQIHHLEALRAACEVTPAVNQIECHPWLTQEELRNYCKTRGIQVEAWSPLAKGRSLDDVTIGALAAKYDKTPAQIILRWHLQNGVVIIPKSVRQDRIIENAQVFDFTLTEEELAKISRLNQNLRTGGDPDTLTMGFEEGNIT